MSNTLSITKQIQAYLEAGNRIDVRKCCALFGTASLSPKIQQIKKKGLDIKSGRKDGDAKITEYWIETGVAK